MRILIIGQCTLHLGRMEFGNIGNYYIIEPFVRELHRCFPSSEIRTTFQMSDDFCSNEKVTRLPVELYYSWTDCDLSAAIMEVGIAELFVKKREIIHKTPYIEEVLSSDLVIDFSGDMWGDNADLVGKDRFFVGLCKDYVPMLLGKKVVMLAGSPGPFRNNTTKGFAKEVFSGFDLITNREGISKHLLEADGFKTNNVVDLACPAFLFESISWSEIENLQELKIFLNRDKPMVGFVICGWNFKQGPFDRWPRNDEEYIQFARVIEHITNNLGARVCLMSHSNGFKKPPEPFELIHGRDYPIIKQLLHVIVSRGLAHDVFVLDGIYSPSQTKAIIGQFDMMVSGRVHAAVAALSQNVPTVIIDYGHEPKAHKLKGFASLTGIENLVADTSSAEDLICKVNICWQNKTQIRASLQNRIPLVKEMARRNFDLLKQVVYSGMSEVKQ